MNTSQGIRDVWELKKKRERITNNETISAQQDWLTL